MWSASFQPIDHVSVSPTDGIGPTQRQRKTLTRVGKWKIAWKIQAWTNPDLCEADAVLYQLNYQTNCRGVARHVVRLYERYRSIKDSTSMLVHESHVFGLWVETARITHFKLRNVTSSIIAKEGSAIIKVAETALKKVTKKLKEDKIYGSYRNRRESLKNCKLLNYLQSEHSLDKG